MKNIQKIFIELFVIIDSKKIMIRLDFYTNIYFLYHMCFIFYLYYKLYHIILYSNMNILYIFLLVLNLFIYNSN